MQLEQVTLQGQFVKLEPLSSLHREGLCLAISDGELWRLSVTLVPHPSEIDVFYEKAKSDYDSGDGLTFAIIEKNTNKVVGSTRFMTANMTHKRLEIGYTFIAESWQKTRVNTDSKYLLLSYAFERLLVNRIEFKTDYLNSVSRKAILRIGAKEEGVLRNHMVMSDGRVRDSVLFSVIRQEWPYVKQNLEAKLTV